MHAACDPSSRACRRGDWGDLDDDWPDGGGDEPDGGDGPAPEFELWDPPELDDEEPLPEDGDFWLEPGDGDD